MHIRSLVALLMVCAVVGLLIAEETSPSEEGIVKEVAGLGGIDWTNRAAFAIGIGGVNPDLPPSTWRRGAIRAAEMDAYRNLLEIIKGVYITSETTVENAITTSDVIRTKIEGYLQCPKKSEPRYKSDGSIEIRVEVPLTREIMESLGLVDQMPEEVVPLSGEKGKPRYTGLVIDARGIGLEPALAPRVLNEDGQEIFGVSMVPRNKLPEDGLVVYVGNVDLAKEHPRVGDNPIVVKGLRAEGKYRTDVVVSNEDARKILESEDPGFLHSAKVVIVLD